MRENIWKYVAAVLTLLLAASSVAVVLLYMQNSELRNYTPPVHKRNGQRNEHGDGWGGSIQREL